MKRMYTAELWIFFHKAILSRYPNRLRKRLIVSDVLALSGRRTVCLVTNNGQRAGTHLRRRVLLFILLSERAAFTLESNGAGSWLQDRD